MLVLRMLVRDVDPDDVLVLRMLVRDVDPDDMLVLGC